MAIVDALLCLLFLIFSLPLSIGKSDWILTFEVFCSVHGFLITILHPMALWTICGLNCDRYYAIAAPLHYSAIINTKKVSIVYCYFYSFIFNNSGRSYLCAI